MSWIGWLDPNTTTDTTATAVKGQAPVWAVLCEQPERLVPALRAGVVHADLDALAAGLDLLIWPLPHLDPHPDSAVGGSVGAGAWFDPGGVGPVAGLVGWGRGEQYSFGGRYPWRGQCRCRG